jgi:DUF4097 and DUF4098 domain-containing protein YvlB
VVLALAAVAVTAQVVIQGAVAAGGVWTTHTSVRRLPVHGPTLVAITVDEADVRVEVGAASEVVVQDDQLIDGVTRERALRAGSQVGLEVDDGGGSVRITEPESAGFTAVQTATVQRRSVLVRVPALATVRARIVSGALRVTGVRGGLDLATDSGGIDVTLPPTTSARLTAIAASGQVSVDPTWRIPVVGAGATQAAVGVLGKGGGESLKLFSQSGDLRLHSSG